MLSYNFPGAWQAVAVDAITPVLAFTTRTGSTVGVRIKNTTASVLHVSIVKAGSTPPTHADMDTNGMADYDLDPGETCDDGAREASDVYLCVDAGSGTARARELF